MCKHFVFIAFLAVVATGCRVAGPQVVDARPPWLQRRQLQRFDPYPDENIGPEVEGGRPPDFGQQRSEAAQSRWVLPNPSQRFLTPGAF